MLQNKRLIKGVVLSAATGARDVQCIDAASSGVSGSYHVITTMRKIRSYYRDSTAETNIGRYDVVP